MNTREFWQILYAAIPPHPLNHFHLHTVHATTAHARKARVPLPSGLRTWARVNEVMARDAAGYHGYFTPAVSPTPLIPALWADLDTDKTAAYQQLRALPLPPNLIVDTGRGYHAYWLLTTPITPAVARPHLRALAAALASDPAVAHPTACLRVPGTHNHKYDPAPLVVVKHYTPGTYPLAPLTQWLCPAAPPPHPPTSPPSTRPPDPNPADYWLTQALDHVAQGAHRNNTGFWLACQLRDAGISQTEAADTLRLYARSVPQEGHPYRETEALYSLRSAYRRAPRPPAQRIHEALQLYLILRQQTLMRDGDQTYTTNIREIRRLRQVVRTQETQLASIIQLLQNNPTPAQIHKLLTDLLAPSADESYLQKPADYIGTPTYDNQF